MITPPHTDWTARITAAAIGLLTAVWAMTLLTAGYEWMAPGGTISGTITAYTPGMAADIRTETGEVRRVRLRPHGRIDQQLTTAVPADPITVDYRRGEATVFYRPTADPIAEPGRPLLPTLFFLVIAPLPAVWVLWPGRFRSLVE